IFLNGSGVDTLLAEAERRGRLAEAVGGLRQVTIVCRGGKPLAALRREGLRPHVTAARPYTTKELLQALSWIDVSDRGVVLVHCGDRNVSVAGHLRARGARLEEICPYEWALPENVQPIAGVVRDAVAHRLDALLFTSQVQCRH